MRNRSQAWMASCSRNQRTMRAAPSGPTLGKPQCQLNPLVRTQKTNSFRVRIPTTAKRLATRSSNQACTGSAGLACARGR